MSPRDIHAIEIVEWMKDNNADIPSAVKKFRKTAGTIQSYCDMLGHVKLLIHERSGPAPLSNSKSLRH